MKRADALTRLSREHHHALVAAQQLRRATPATAAEARAAFGEFWREHGRHFRAEEEILLPAYVAHGDPGDPVIARVLVDHVLIRSDAAALAGGGVVALNVLHRLGKRLAEHVRCEERELFPAVEAALPPEELDALARALEEAE
jgi:hypothetical protein